MTDMTTTAASAGRQLDNASATDTWLKKYSTPLTATTAIVACITGVMMFFNFFKGDVKAMHEWLGMAFVVATVLHLVRHRRPLTFMMKQGRTLVLLVMTLLVSAAFLYPGAEKQSNPIRPMINAVLRAPIKDLAPVLKISGDEMMARLEDAGVKSAAPADSIEQLAKSTGTEPFQLLNAVMNPPKDKD